MSSDTQTTDSGSVAHQRDYAVNTGEVDLKKYLYTLWIERWTILWSVIVGAILALLIAFWVTPSYTGDGTMMIKQTQQSSSLMNMLGNNAVSGLISNSFGIGGGVNIANEQEVLESRRLFDAMAEKLLKDPIMESGRMYPVLWKDWPDDSVMTERRYIAARIKNNITYELQSGTTIIEISYDSPSRLEATDMVNLVMQTYQEISKQQNIALAGSATEFLDSQEVEIQDSLQHAEEHMEQFMDTHDIVALDDQTSNLINQIADLQRQKYEAEVKLKGTNASIKEYEKRLNELKPGLSKKLAEAIGPNIEKLQFKISELKTEKALIYSRQPALKKNDTPPGKVKNINSQVAKLQEQLEQVTDSLVSSNEEFIGFLGQGESGSVITTLTNYSNKLIQLRVEKLQYRAQIKYLTEQLQGEQQFMENLPENAMDLARLKRNVKVQEELYLAVTKQRAQMNMSTQAELGNSRPLDKAIIPEKPSYPNYLLFLLIGIFTMGFLSVSYVTVKSVMSETIDSVSFLKKIPIPLLSIVPECKRISDGVLINSLLPMVDEGKKSSFTQSIHRLANNIIHADRPELLKVISINSYSEGAGKSTVSAQVAAALARAGNEVILVETDARSSELPSANKAGLSDVINKKTALEDAIIPSDIPRLHFLSAGSSGEAGPYLQSPKFKNIVGTLRDQFKFIIFDVPALDKQNDAADLASVTDTSVVIAEFRKTKLSEIEFVEEQLKKVNIPILGLVLNKYNPKKAPEYSMSAYRSEKKKKSKRFNFS